MWYFKLINLGAKKKGCETESSACPTQKRHLGWTIENPELLREHDQRNIDQTISLSAAYNDAQLLFKSALYGIAFVCMYMPRCHGLMCWHRATSGEHLTLCLLLSFAFIRREREGVKAGEGMTEKDMKRANTGEIKQKAKDKGKYDGNMQSE